MCSPSRKTAMTPFIIVLLVLIVGWRIYKDYSQTHDLDLDYLNSQAEQEYKETLSTKNTSPTYARVLATNDTYLALREKFKHVKNKLLAITKDRRDYYQNANRILILEELQGISTLSEHEQHTYKELCISNDQIEKRFQNLLKS